jgi:hypothetical protein
LAKSKVRFGSFLAVEYTSWRTAASERKAGVAKRTTMPFLNRLGICYALNHHIYCAGYQLLTDKKENQLTLLGRLTDSLINRRTGVFVAELVLVIAGVLIALAVDEWISDSRDRQTEAAYLELLARDIEEIRNQAELQVEFEQEKIDMGTRAYEALSTPDPKTKQTEIGSLLALLITRRTISLSSATYDQMVSSGHLQLIRNHELRNRIVRFFATMARNEQIIGNNNRELIDRVFIPFAMRTGISALQRRESTEITASLNRATAIIYERLGPDFSPPEDRVLSEPADSDSWNDIRRNVLFRIRIAATGQALAESTVDQIDQTATAISAELNGR